MKDSQGTNIINPETVFNLRNLREKALHENKDREFYINQFLADTVIKIQTEGISKMEAFERYVQEWCLKNGIVGYEYICKVNIKVQ